MKQNYLDKENRLTLNTITAEILSVHNYTESEQLIKKAERKQKSE